MKTNITKNNRSKAVAVIGIAAVCCIIMALVDGVLKPVYPVKSAVKIALFLICPLVYARFDKETALAGLFRFRRRGLSVAVLLGLGVYGVIIAAYFITRDVFDFSGITGALAGNAGVTKDNFIWVALYISFANSTLEEFFFRGFAFFSLKRLVSRRFAYLFSPALFALYHIAMMSGWFSLSVFAITIVGLFCGAAIFNYLDERYDCLYPSLMVHLFANLAINTIGLILFGII